MGRIAAALACFRKEPGATHPTCPFRLTSTVSSPVLAGEVEAEWGSYALPDDAVDLWSAASGARLFEDKDFGQWGLVLLDPRTSRERTTEERVSRPSEYRDDDVVIGTFLGDQELLVIAPSERGRRRILVALPLDERRDWFGVAPSLAAFLESLFRAGGQKYWEAEVQSSDGATRAPSDTGPHE